MDILMSLFLYCFIINFLYLYKYLKINIYKFKYLKNSILKMSKSLKFIYEYNLKAYKNKKII